MSITNRLLFPADRSSYIYQGAFQPILTPPVTSVVIYEDEAATIPADVVDLNGNPLSGSTIQTDASGMLPEFYGPVGNVARVWAVIAGAAGSSATPLDAEFGAQVNVLPTIFTGTGGPSGLPTDTSVSLGSIYIDTSKLVFYGPYSAEGWPAGQPMSSVANPLVSVFGRTGTVTAQTGDYTAAQVGADTAGAASSAQTAAQSFATSAVATETGRAETAEGTLTSSLAAEVSRAETAEALLAPKASPSLTGTPTAPTAGALTNTTQVATTAYTDAAVGVETARAEGVEATKAASSALTAETGRAEAAEALLAPLASPALTGTPTAPTATALTSTTQVATTSYADTAVGVERTRAQTAEGTNATAISTETARAETAEALLAPLASPALTGTPTAPTKTPLTSNTDIATTAYADNAVGVETTRAETAEALKAPLSSPTLTGTPVAPTAAALTNNTQVATTAYADGAVGVETTRALAAEATRQIVAPASPISRGRDTLIANYASGHGWTANAFATSNVNDTSDGRLSGQMLTGTTTGNSGVFPTFTKTGASSVSLTGNALRVWVKVDVPTNVTAITLRAAGTGGIAGNNYLSWTALSSGSGFRTNGLLIPPNTWTELSFSLGSAFTTGTPTPGAITEYRWICQDNGTAFTVHFGGIEMYSALSERYPNGVVCIGFDDCYSGQYSLAMNLLSSYGYQATIFPIIDQIGAGGSWTLAQLQQMVNIGWEVAPHASTLANHSGWNGLTSAQIVADVLASQTWIAGQGFGLSGTFAYPLGGFNNGADTAVAPLVKVARTIDSTLYTETLPVGNPLHMRSAAGVGGSGGIGVTTYTTATTGVLALAKAAGALVPITIHDVSSGTSGNINQISIADLTTLVSAINTAGMAVATYGEVLQYAMTGVNTQPIAATNPTIVISGPANAPTIGVGTLAESNITNLVTDLAAKAPLASPSLTGTPVAPTATALTNTTQVATTAYADSAVSVEKTRALAAEGTNTTAINNLASGSTNITGALHVAFSSTTTRSGIKVENTANTSGNSNSALVELKGNSPTAAVDWLFGTDYGENGSNNWFVQDSNNGLRLFVDSTGRLVVGDSTAGPAAANSLDVVGSIKTRGTNSMSPLNICGRSSAYGAPTSGTWQTGDAILDVSGQWYYCTSAGTPGTWTSLQQGGSATRQLSAAAMNIDLSVAADTIQNTAGNIYYSTLWVESPIASVGHIYCRVKTTAGSALTNTYLGVYDVLTGNRLGLTADLSTSFQSAGTITASLTSAITGLTWNQQLYVAMVIGSATTMPAMVSCAPGMANLGLATGGRYLVKSGSATALPTTVSTSLSQSGSGQTPAFMLAA